MFLGLFYTGDILRYPICSQFARPNSAVPSALVWERPRFLRIQDPAVHICSRTEAFPVRGVLLTFSKLLTHAIRRIDSHPPPLTLWIVEVQSRYGRTCGLDCFMIAFSQ